MKRSKTKLMMAAKLKRKAPEAKKSLGSVDGASARRSFSKPTRMKRAEGGTTISEDSKREIARLKKEEPASVGNPNALITGAGAATAYHGLAKSKWPIPVRGLMGGLGIGTAAMAGKKTAEDIGKMKDSTYEQGRIRRGMAEPGKEDRKRGGKVCK